MKTTEIDLLRLAVAVGVNVVAARYVAGLFKINRDIGGAVAIGAMLYTSGRTLDPPDEPTLLDRAAATLTAPGALVVNVLAQSGPEIDAP